MLDCTGGIRRSTGNVRHPRACLCAVGDSHRHLINPVGCSLHFFVDHIEFLAGGFDLFGSVFDRPDSRIERLGYVRSYCLDLGDSGFDLFGPRARLFGEGFDLFCNDRKAGTRLARPGGLDRRVERQQVGLVGDIADHIDDLVDL